jgi:hypothetical protein
MIIGSVSGNCSSSGRSIFDGSFLILGAIMPLLGFSKNPEQIPALPVRADHGYLDLQSFDEAPNL